MQKYIVGQMCLYTTGRVISDHNMAEITVIMRLVFHISKDDSESLHERHRS